MTQNLRYSLALLLGLVLSFAVTQAPQASPPPLVPCNDATEAPCVLLATQLEDIVGVWKQYLGNPTLGAPGGMGYIRYAMDGSYFLADAPENTAAPYANYPRGSYAFENGLLVIRVDSTGMSDFPQECATARYELRVYRYGQQPVALFYTPVEDECRGRLMDLRYPLVWVGAAD